MSACQHVPALVQAIVTQLPLAHPGLFSWRNLNPILLSQKIAGMQSAMSQQTALRPVASASRGPQTQQMAGRIVPCRQHAPRQQRSSACRPVAALNIDWSDPDTLIGAFGAVLGARRTANVSLTSCVTEACAHYFPMIIGKNLDGCSGLAYVRSLELLARAAYHWHAP